MQRINWHAEVLEIKGEPIRLVIEIREGEERLILHSSFPLDDTSAFRRILDRESQMTFPAHEAK